MSAKALNFAVDRIRV